MKKLLFATILVVLAIVLLAVFFPKASKPKEVSLKVIHAGSLTQPVREVEKNFQELYKEKGIIVNFLDESAGSVDVVKQISELHKNYDVVLTADSYLIPQYLMGQFANWYIEFATNKLVLCYTDKSKFSGIINASNWFEILQKSGVEFGYSDPNSDPAGYRTILLFKLAEIYYNKPNLSKTLIKLTKPNNIRPKSVELIALLQANELDYAFEYESVAVQNNLKYVSLPDEINLGNPNFKDFYKKASFTLKDGTIITGAPIVYGLTIPSNAENKDLAEEFVYYLLSNGKEIFKKYGQPFIEFIPHPDVESIPEVIRKVLK